MGQQPLPEIDDPPDELLHPHAPRQETQDRYPRVDKLDARILAVFRVESPPPPPETATHEHGDGKRQGDQPGVKLLDDAIHVSPEALQGQGLRPCLL